MSVYSSMVRCEARPPPSKLAKDVLIDNPVEKRNIGQPMKRWHEYFPVGTGLNPLI